MDKQRRMSPPVVGGSSLLVIFAVLCLTVFALLGLSTVQAGSRLSEATTRSVTEYYEADCLAEEIFARLRAGELPSGVTGEGDRYFYTCPISETRQLQVSLQRDGEEWTVLRWQTVSVADWEAEDDLAIWDGTE